jgi:tetratricopeptide (TPR) repeat protein
MGKRERGRQHHAVLVALVLFFEAATALGQANLGAALYAQAGWDALAAGQPRAAAEAFERALATDPKTATLHLGAALAAFAERRDDDARAFANRALDLDPSLWRGHEVIGRAQYRQGDLDGAIRTFERLVSHQPARPAFDETLARWRREAELRDRMRLEVGSRFTVAFEGAEDASLAEAAVASLERASARIGDVLGVYPVEPIRVVLYTAADFRDITRAPDWAGGAFDAGIIRVPVRGALANRPEFERVLAHEYVHALVFTLAPRGVPAWVNEGLAVALQHETSDPATFLPMHLDTLTRPFGRFARADAERAYATSGLAMRRLLDEVGGTAAANLLRDIGHGVPFGIAFAQRMHRTVAEFDASLTSPR